MQDTGNFGGLPRRQTCSFLLGEPSGAQKTIRPEGRRFKPVGSQKTTANSPPIKKPRPAKLVGAFSERAEGGLQPF
ncbi:MAG: hypothetical protein A2508_09110 [Candidatus Lambdaproteobacteria bacterium RIFOXYD12_FULL_49_8]|uniref:Uncharacterized protein n=1 Tax=Candidatus Lambdaproteobacteria bacterium RIFOXYD2_FULL_50_16 TaxID=1817772 RepID=A0A1F6GBA5_9PROT|nr:MAG: hypothetical protein A2527_07535 [Candidatus Lambdaproteobacteria bacterium RIFOXYD2_FULL_50_16]OGG97574.1 MAG: hypothetical protein A2508_09110 [Candidatus Lambdaproteobacteria bacterium RIFOXYD12_FULL_49_8]